MRCCGLPREEDAMSTGDAGVFKNEPIQRVSNHRDKNEPGDRSIPK